MSLYEAASSLSDGRGGEITPGRLEPKSAHRYIYYRLYAKDGALESNNPIYSNDRFISRFPSNSVAPPHTGASLKKHLCRIEGFEELENCFLYLSISATTTLEDSARLSLRGNTGPGPSENDPAALVVEICDLEKRSAPSAVGSKTLPERHGEARYIYYRVYDQGGEVSSKTSFNETNPPLGRINTLVVPPPHTVSSLMSCLIKVEGISTRDVQLFEDEYGETNMNDANPIELSSDHYPGIMQDEPIVIVYQSQKSSSTSKLQDSGPPQDPEFSKQIELRVPQNWSSPDPAWHSFTGAAIFKTDGILRRERYNGGSKLECYLAMDSAGKKAFVEPCHVDFC